MAQHGKDSFTDRALKQLININYYYCFRNFTIMLDNPITLTYTDNSCFHDRSQDVY